MPFIPLQIPKGQYRNGTDLMSQGRWRDVDLVRWHEDALRPIGGWRQRQSVNISGVARSIIAWEDNSANRRLATGTFNKLYALQADGTSTDITPVGLTAGRVDATINTGYGASFYGREEYGLPRADSENILKATVWSLDNYGEFLLAMSPDDGKLYQWQLNNAVKAAQVTNSPTSCSGFMVTEERFVVCFGDKGLDSILPP